MARRFGSAMISNTDCTLFIYYSEYIRVKAYNSTTNGWIVQLGVNKAQTAAPDELAQYQQPGKSRVDGAR